MVVPRMVYDALCQLYGEKFVRRYYVPISVIRR